jgi:hypothetical protein
MYCVFCGVKDVAACTGCRHWVCPRHRRQWFGRAVCIGCHRKLVRTAAVQAVVAVIACAVIAAAVGWLIRHS